MSPTKAEPDLCILRKYNELIGMNWSYVDDMLQAGNRAYENICQRTHDTFESSRDDHVPFTFAGLNIDHTNGTLSIDQRFYLSKLEELPMESSYCDYRSMRIRTAWLAITRPDLVFSISKWLILRNQCTTPM